MHKSESLLLPKRQSNLSLTMAILARLLLWPAALLVVERSYLATATRHEIPSDSAQCRECWAKCHSLKLEDKQNELSCECLNDDWQDQYCQDQRELQETEAPTTPLITAEPTETPQPTNAPTRRKAPPVIAPLANASTFAPIPAPKGAVAPIALAPVLNTTNKTAISPAAPQLPFNATNNATGNSINATGNVTLSPSKGRVPTTKSSPSSAPSPPDDIHGPRPARTPVHTPTEDPTELPTESPQQDRVVDHAKSKTQPKSSDGGGLSAGGKFGVVIVVLAVVGILGYMLFGQNRSRRGRYRPDGMRQMEMGRVATRDDDNGLL
jgi:hypothetical protein